MNIHSSSSSVYHSPLLDIGLSNISPSRLIFGYSHPAPASRLAQIVTRNEYNMYDLQFGRWSFLTVGVVYGVFHQSRLSKKEELYREVEAKEKAVKDAKIKAEKALAAAGMDIILIDFSLKTNFALWSVRSRKLNNVLNGQLVKFSSNI
jgi:hypothetical protein